MFCNQCGKEIPDTVSICPNCGANLEQAKASLKGAESCSTDSGSGVTNKNEGFKMPNLSAENLSKIDIKKIPIIPIAIVLCLIIIICIVSKVFSNRKPTLKLNDYVSVEYEGYNAAGIANVHIDYDKFAKDYGKKLKLTSAGKKELDDMDVSDLSKYEGEQLASDMFRNVLIGELDKSDHLSNGDVIKYIWMFDEEMVTSAVKCKLDYSDIEFKVEGLETVDSFDPFADIEVEFNGVEPDGKASFTNNSADSMIRELSFSFDRESGLSNGDKVTLKVYAGFSEPDEEYFISNYGKVPSQLEKQYEVSGLGKYVSETSEIPEELMERMKKQAEDTFMNEAAEWRNDDESSQDTRKIRKSTVESLNYIGSYFLTSKNSDTWGGYHNMLTLVYKPVATIERIFGDEDYYKNDVYYWYITFHDILIDQEGKAVMDLNSYDKCSNQFGRSTGISWMGYDAYGFNGYEHIDDVYRDVVSKNLEKYNHEDNIADIDENELLKDIKPRETTDETAVQEDEEAQQKVSDNAEEKSDTTQEE